MLRLFNRKQLAARDFEGGEAGVRLQPEPFKRFLEAYEAAMTERSAGEGTPMWREQIGKQCDALRGMLMERRFEDFYTWPG